MLNKLTAIVPAKSRSQRLPGKNIRNFLGRPLLWFSIQCALHAKGIGRVIVSTESSGIAERAADCGAKIPFLRPQALAKAETPMLNVIAHAFSKLPDEKSLVLLQPTSPLRLPEDIDAGLKLFLSERSDSLVSVTALRTPGGIFSITDRSRLHFAQQKPDSSQYFALNGALYIVTRRAVERGSLLGEKVLAHIMPQERSVDIDTEEDLKLAEIFAKGLHLDEIFNRWERDR